MMVLVIVWTTKAIHIQYHPKRSEAALQKQKVLTKMIRGVRINKTLSDWGKEGMAWSGTMLHLVGGFWQKHNSEKSIFYDYDQDIEVREFGLGVNA